MKTLYNRFDLGNPKEFIKTREFIGKTFFTAFMLIYGFMWVKAKPIDTPDFSYIFTFALIPVLIYGLYMRMSHYMFLYNWFYMLYCLVTGTMFFIVMSYFHPIYDKFYVGFEIGHGMVANGVGVAVAIAISFPFKIVHWFLFQPNKFYYNLDTIGEINDRIYPERKKAKAEKEKQKFVYDTLNETQLQAELSAAIKEDRFEDATKIQKILETKFR